MSVTKMKTLGTQSIHLNPPGQKITLACYAWQCLKLLACIVKKKEKVTRWVPLSKGNKIMKYQVQ